MAEGIAKHLIESGALEGCALDSITISSAGVSAFGGSPASLEAVEALNSKGIDISGHSSQPLSAQLVRESTAIYCMTDSHLMMVQTMGTEAQNKSQLLDPEGSDVADPIGMPLTCYEETAEQIAGFIRARLTELVASTT